LHAGTRVHPLCRGVAPMTLSSHRVSPPRCLTSSCVPPRTAQVGRRLEERCLAGRCIAPRLGAEPASQQLPPKDSTLPGRIFLGRSRRHAGVATGSMYNAIDGASASGARHRPAEARPRQGAEEFSREHAECRQHRHPPRSRKFPQIPAGIWGDKSVPSSRRRRYASTRAGLRDAERSRRAARGRDARRHRVRSGSRERRRGPTRTRRIPADLRGNLGGARVVLQADGGEARPRQYFSTTRSRAAELPGPLCTRAAWHGGLHDASSSSQTSTFSAEPAWCGGSTQVDAEINASRHGS
jgi:hypothetical protein